MKKLFRNNKGKLLLTEDAELASILGYKEEVPYKILDERMFKTGIIDLDENRELTTEEAEKLEEKLNDIYEAIDDYSVQEIEKIINKYSFVFVCDYRGGEKHSIVAVTAWEEPEQKCCDYMDNCEMWDCMPIAFDAWHTLREIMDLKSIY